MNPNPVPAPAPPKKSSSGCLVGLAIAGGVALVACLIGGVVVWRATQSEDGKKFTSALGKGISLATKGINAPGTPELRKAGCTQAIVLEGEDVAGMVEIFVDAGSKAHNALDAETFIICQGGMLDTLPSCDTVAETYVKAVGPKSHSFIVSVQKQGRADKTCQREYEGTGVFIRDYDGHHTGR